MRIIAPGANLPRIRGHFYITFNKLLQKHVVHKWPRKRPNVSPVTAQQNATLVSVMQLLKKRTGEDQQGAIDITKNTPFLAQDALVSAAQGTLVRQLTSRQGTIWSARIMFSEVQALLNSISSIEGSMLLRTATQWEALLPGSPTQLLTIDPVTGQPSWADAPSPGNTQAGYFSGLQSNNPQSVDTGTAASIGLFWTPSVNQHIETVVAQLKPAATTQRYQATICGLGGRTVGSSITPIQTVAGIVPANTDQLWYPFTFSPQIALVAGTLYGIAITRTDGTATSPINFIRNNLETPRQPLLNAPGSMGTINTSLAWRAASKALVNTDTISALMLSNNTPAIYITGFIDV